MVDALLILACILSVLLAISLTFHLFLWVPYVGTQPAVVSAMVSAANVKPGEKLFDLGAGDGRILIAALKNCPQATATAVELRPSVWLQGVILSWWKGAHIRWLWRDVRRVDLSDADVVFVYLTPHLLNALLPKLQKELKPGARVISHDFWWPAVTAEQVIPVDTHGRTHKVLMRTAPLTA